MIKALSIGNFKSFADIQRAPLRPLTLLYGANSSGKSSILHSLLLAHHVSETGDFDVHLTKIGGDAVDLGGFRQFVHGANRDLRVTLEWELSGEYLSGKMTGLLPRFNECTIGLDFGLSGYDRNLVEELGSVTPRQIILWLINDAKEKGDQVEIEKLESKLDESEDTLTLEEILKLKSTLRIASFWLEFDGDKFISATARSEGNLRLDTLNQEHKVAKFLIENLILAHSTTDHIDGQEFLAMSDAIDELVPKISFKIGTLLPQRLISKYESESRTKGFSLIPVRKETRLEDLRKVIESNLPSIIESIVVGISSEINNQFRRLTYLGPLRTYPPRHIGISKTNDPNWQAGGGLAWDIIKNDFRLREKVNEWLADENKLSTSYELRIRNLVTVDSLKAKISELTSKAVENAWDEVNRAEEEGDYRYPLEEIEEALIDVPDRLQKIEMLFSDMNDLVLFDRRSKTVVSHRDVGIGISQMLPVIVTAFASRNKIIAIEQPEIHLHPALQAELSDVFIESALGENKNTFIIETHSEHLLLRIMRRIRETTAGNLPEEALPIKPEDVMILFVEPEGSRSIIHEMPLNKRGELVKEWPGGFFEEDFEELF